MHYVSSSVAAVMVPKNMLNKKLQCLFWVAFLKGQRISKAHYLELKKRSKRSLKPTLATRAESFRSFLARYGIKIIYF